MIRHTPSFLISIIIHLLLLVVFIYTYKYVTSLETEKKDEKVCLKLTCIVEKHTEHIIEKPKPQKITPPKPQPKLKPKVEKPKIKIPKKEVIKKLIPKPLTVPVVKEIVEPKKEPEVVYVEPVKEEEIVEEEVFVVESQEEKAIAQEQEYMDEHIKKIIRLLSDNLYYPRSARKRGIVGEVLVKFCLSVDATVSKIEVISSHSDILSRAARKTIEDLSGEFPKPPEELVLHVPINYELKR